MNCKRKIDLGATDRTSFELLYLQKVKSEVSRGLELNESNDRNEWMNEESKEK